MGKIKVICLSFEKMQFYVKTLTGKTITIEDDGDKTVACVKNQICLEEGVQFHQQKLILAGKLLEDDMNLSNLEIAENAVVDLVINSLVVPLRLWIQLLCNCRRSIITIRKSAVSAMPLCHQEPRSAERDPAVTGLISDQERPSSRSNF